MRRLTKFSGQMYRRTRAFNRVSHLATSRPERIRQLVMFLWLFLTDHAEITVGRPVSMRTKHGTFLLNDHSEALVIGEIFVDRCYADENLPLDVDTVIDLGCNIGATSIWFSERYPNAEVIGVEADPRTARLAHQNVAGHGRIRVVSAAVSDHPGTVTLNLGDSWASTVVGNGSGKRIDVSAVPLDELLDGGGSRRLLKIDIEGGEHQVLRGCSRLREVEFITGEFHPVEGETWGGMLDSLDGFEVRRSRPTADGRYMFTARRI